MKELIPNWSFLNTFNGAGIEPDSNPEWIVFDVLIKKAHELLEEQWVRDAEIVAAWDERLRDYGGDPCHRHWVEFRPLRLEREEDWSDWLAWLLGNSRTGSLAREIFHDAIESTPADLAGPEVQRELPTPQGTRRMDFFIEWKDGAFTHVEVKIGDENFDKTFEVARELYLKYPKLTNFILVPKESLPKWKEKQVEDSAAMIYTVTWDDLAVALRKELWAGKEDISWKVWAYSFCGAIEQELLGYDQIDWNMRYSGPVSLVLQQINQVELMRETMKDE